MGKVLVLGEAAQVEAYALAGAEVVVAEDPESVVRAWSAVTTSVALVVLTSRAAAAIEQGPGLATGAFTVVMAP